MQALINNSCIPILDANYRDTLDSNADLYMRAICYLIEAIAESSNSIEVEYLKLANAKIKNSNIIS